MKIFNKRRTWVISIAIALLIGPSLVPAHAVKIPSCSPIIVDPTVKKGIKLQCLDGNSTYVWQGIRGPAIVNVWGSWCYPCRQEIPLLVRLAKTKKIQVIGIDVVESKPSDGIGFMTKNSMTWPQLGDPKSLTKGVFGPGVPITRFIDSNGVGIYEKAGPFKDWAEIQRAMKVFFRIDV